LGADLRPLRCRVDRWQRPSPCEDCTAAELRASVDLWGYARDAVFGGELTADQVRAEVPRHLVAFRERMVWRRRGTLGLGTDNLLRIDPVPRW